MLDKNPFQIDDFKGINRGSTNSSFGNEYQDQVPFDEALQAENIVFLKEGGFQTRPPFRTKLQLYTDNFDPATGASDPGIPIQVWKIARLGNTYYDNRWLYVTRDDNDNLLRIYDSANIVAGDNTPIKKITGAKFISALNIYGRIYISPLVDFGSPLTGSDGVIWLYDGTTFRKAGGTGPTAGTLTITGTAVAGANVTPGLHIGAIAFETDSGFITPPGPATRIQVTITAGGGRAARFANIDLGPTGTVARHLLLTKTIPTYDGIQNNWELFFALRIPNNTATTGDVVLPDTGLIESADYLLDEYSSLPACNSISKFNTHIMYNGINTDTRVINVSKGNDPETVDQTEDYIQNFDSIPVDFLNSRELRGTCYLFKENSTFSTREEDAPPNTWRVDLVDSGIGISPMGVADVMANHGGLVLDNLIVGGLTGIYIFSGTYSHLPLSIKLQGIIDSYSRAALKYLRMAVDPTRRRLYLLIGDPFGGGNLDLWVGDYYRGLDPNNIRWAKWTIFIPGEAASKGFVSIIVDPSNNATTKPNIALVAQGSNKLLEPREDLIPGWDNEDPPGNKAVEISWIYQTGFTANLAGYLYTFTNLLIRAALKLYDDTIDNKIIKIFINSMDDPVNITGIPANTQSIEATPKKDYNILTGDYVAEKASVTITGKNAVFINKLILWVSEKAKTRPR